MSEAEDQPTVEQCLAELREMFPKRWIAITASTHSAKALQMKTVFTICIDQLVDDFEDLSLAGCMAQVRKWHEEQKR